MFLEMVLLIRLHMIFPNWLLHQFFILIYLIFLGCLSYGTCVYFLSCSLQGIIITARASDFRHITLIILIIEFSHTDASTLENKNYQGPERRKKEAFNPFALVYLYLVLSYQFHLMESG